MQPPRQDVLARDAFGEDGKARARETKIYRFKRHVERETERDRCNRADERSIGKFLLEVKFICMSSIDAL